MIYTITLNPALDYVLQVDNFKAGKLNRNKKESIFYSGKGINVSCILKELGHESTALGFIAGFTGNALHEGLTNQGIHTDFVEVEKGLTRINVKVKSNEETEINGMGPVIEKKDFELFLEKLQSAGANDWLIMSGSIPSSMESDTYEKIIEAVDPAVNFVVDAEKNLLRKILKFHPFLIKPNHHELAQMFDVELKNDEDLIFYAKKLQELGARNVLVSMAGDGAILVAENGENYKLRAAKGEVINSVGAGDSMVAGFIAGYLKTSDYEYALKLGTACGGATAFQSGLATKQQIEETLLTL